MLDLNDLRIFERVSSLKSFAQASRALAMPPSSVSRAIARLETELGTRLLQRTTREVALTPTGALLKARCADVMQQVERAVDEVGAMTGAPRGMIKVSAGVGFGINVLSEQLPAFLSRCPEVNVELDLRSELTDLVADRVDIAIRMGPLRDATTIAVRLGTLTRCLCASMTYVSARGLPNSVESLREHDWIAMRGPDGRAIPVQLSRGDETIKVEPRVRVCSNEALTQYRLVLGGAGVGVISGYLVAPEISKGNLVHILPEWEPAPIEVNMLFPTKREMAPAVRAFVDFMTEVTSPDVFWQIGPGS